MLFFRKYLLNILMIIILFIAINPIQDEVLKLDSSFYSLKEKGVFKKNYHSKWKKKGTGKFLVHAGEKNDIKAKFKIKKSTRVLIDFKMNEKSKLKCIVRKNKNRILKQTIRETKPLILEVSLNKGDTLEIEVSKRKDGAWATLNLKNKNEFYYFEYTALLIVWIFLFILLAKNGYIALFYLSYGLFFTIAYAEKVTFHALSFEELWTYMGLIFSLTFISVLFYQYFKKWGIAFFITFMMYGVLFFIFLLFILYLFNFNQPINQEILYAIFQSNSKEASEYLSDFVSLGAILLFIISFVLLGIILFLQNKSKKKFMDPLHLVFYIIIFSSIFFFKFETLHILSFTQLKAERYTAELNIFNTLKDKIKTGEIEFNASKKETNETYVVILGESLNKHHMGLYGYFRDTTPRLDKLYDEGEILKFTNTYANYINTINVWSQGLTQANQYNDKSYYNALNILNILKKASIESYWITNQSLYGGWDNMISVIAHQADHVIGINYSIGRRVHTEHFDEVLIEKVKKILAQKSNKTRVLFVHLMGNHSTYSKRYPEKYNYFKDKPKGFVTNKVNYYDNSVLYNDFIVSNFIEEIQKEEGVRGIIYMPDHAEDVIHNKGHHSGKRFTFDMVQIPFLCWFSKEYQSKYTDRYEIFKSNQNRLFSNDMFYDTLLGLLHVDTDTMNEKYDLSSSKYELKDKDALTQHGKKHYNSKKNRFFKEVK